MLAIMKEQRPYTRRKAIAAKIKDARLRAGLSQEGLGGLVTPNVSGATISTWERGEAGLEVAQLEDLARVLDQPLQFFLGQAVPRRDTEAEAIGNEVLRIVQRHGYSNIRRVEAHQPTQAGQMYPIRNRISASEAVDAQSQVQDEIFIPDELTRGCREVIIFFVTGDCLRDEGIRIGDHLIIDGSRKEPENGEIVAAVVNRMETAKLYYNLGTHIELRPASPGFDTIVVREGDELEIVGCYHNVLPTGKRGRK